MNKLWTSATLRNVVQSFSRRNLSLGGISQGTHKMPERLKSIGENDDPNFFEMVEYNFHRAVEIMEDSFLKELDKYPHMSPEDKVNRFKAIIDVMSNCQAVLEVTFPIKRDSGEYVLLTGYRAHHNSHRYNICQ